MFCRPGYTAVVRHVTESTKNIVYASYGIHSHTRATYEMDHLTPLELGGSNRRLCMTRLVLIATREDDKEPMRGAV